MLVEEYKNIILMVRRVPAIIAGASFLNTFLFIIKIDTILLSILFGSSFLFIFVLWKFSKLFKFCIYHKICLIYAFIMETFNTIDFLIGIPISWNVVCYLFYLLSFIVFVSVIIFKKCNL